MPTRKTERRIYVRATRPIVFNDGDTAVVVLKGTSGFVLGNEGVTRAPYADAIKLDGVCARTTSRAAEAAVADPARYGVAVRWRTVVISGDHDGADDNAVASDWALPDSPVDALEFVDVKTVYADADEHLLAENASPPPAIAIRSVGGVTTLVVTLSRLEEVFLNESGKISEHDVPGLMANICGQAANAGAGDAALAETYRDLYAKQAYCDACGCAPCECEDDS